jgi:Transcriptional regulatory protein, C terminal
VARIHAVLRRARPGRPPLAAATRIASANLLLDRTSRRAWLDGAELSLTPKAIALLEYLVTHPDELITRQRLLDAVWGWVFRPARARWTRALPSCAAPWGMTRPTCALSRPCLGRVTGLSARRMMRGRHLWPWLAALIPAGLGLAAGLWLGSGQTDNPIFVVCGPLAAWLSRLGLLVSLLLLGGLAIGAWQARRSQRRLAEVQT